VEMYHMCCDVGKIVRMIDILVLIFTCFKYMLGYS